MLGAELQALKDLLGDSEWLTYDYHIELQAAPPGRSYSWLNLEKPVSSQIGHLELY